MNTIPNNNVSRELDGGGHDVIGGVLASALDMEDQISGGVYQDYLKQHNWPPGFDKDDFLEIRKRLTILIQGIEKHKKTLHALSKEYDRGRQTL